MIKHLHVSECDSTQDLLKEQLSGSDKDHGIIVSCDEQLNGHGRGDNRWISLPGSLCFSFTIAPHPKPSFTALEVSVLITQFFEDSKLTLKWPNDLLNKHQKKCCGILIQSIKGTMVAGVGLNLYSQHPVFGGIYDDSFEFNKKSEANEIVKFINSNRYPNEVKLIKDWEDKCQHMNEEVSLTEGDMVVVGRFKGLGEYGEATVVTDNGEKKFFNGSLRIIS